MGRSGLPPRHNQLSLLPQGRRLAVHVLTMAGPRPLRRLLLYRPLRRAGFHEGPAALRYPEADDCIQPRTNPPLPLGFPEGLLLLADRPLQLAVPTCGLFQHGGGHAGRRHDLVVFLLKVHRLPRLILFCAAKEMGSPLHAPCCPPWHHAIHRLVGNQVSEKRFHFLSTIARFVGGGHTTFCGFLNMGVHVVMYFYYLMSAMGPSVQKYLWWKR